MHSFTIQTPKGKRVIGEGQPCFIIAEMSVNHNQDFNKAVKILEAAASAGADAIKLQTFMPDVATLDSEKKWFIIEGDNPWQRTKIYDLYKKAQTPWEWHPRLKKLAEELGLILFSTPLHESAVDFLETLDVPLYKIASYEVTHIPLLKKIAGTGKPVIMSTGFAAQAEVKLAVSTLRKNGAGDIALLHCVTAYSDDPKADEVNLRTMIDLRDYLDVVCGFSDNNAGIDIPLQAVMMGASIIEKHLIADYSDDTFDKDFSVDPKEFKKFVDAVRRSEIVMGRVHYGPQSKREELNKFFRRSIFTVEDIKKGDKFTEDNIRVIRPSHGLEPKYYEEVIGKTANHAIEKGTPLYWEAVEK